MYRIRWAACLMLTAAMPSPAAAEWLEFRGSSLSGRVDIPTKDVPWRLGDDNGNGAMDANEALAPPDGFKDFHATVAPPPAHSDLLSKVIQPNSDSVLFIDENLNGTLDDNENVVGIYNDYPDVYEFRTDYRFLNVNAFDRWRTAQLMQTFAFGRESNSTDDFLLELSLGARFFGCSQIHVLQITGGLIPDISGTNKFENQTVGPQIAMRANRRVGRWNLDVTGALSAGYVSSVSDYALDIERRFSPPGFLYLANIAPFPDFRQQSEEHRWTPLAEAGVRLSYDWSERVTTFLTGNAGFFGDQPLPFGTSMWNYSFITGNSQAVQYAFAMVGIQWSR